MKIAIIGYSASGKSTLAKKLADYYNAPCLHMDALRFQPNWITSDNNWMKSQVQSFLQQNNSWVIDGNYSFCLYHERMQESDLIIYLNFSRLNSLFRAVKRYIKYHGKNREDMANGCKEKLDWEFIRWILKDGRSKESKERYQSIQKFYPEKFIQLHNQNEINRFLKTLK